MRVLNNAIAVSRGARVNRALYRKLEDVPLVRDVLGNIHYYLITMQRYTYTHGGVKVKVRHIERDETDYHEISIYVDSELSLKYSSFTIQQVRVSKDWLSIEYVDVEGIRLAASYTAGIYLMILNDYNKFISAIDSKVEAVVGILEEKGITSKE